VPVRSSQILESGDRCQAGEAVDAIADEADDERTTDGGLSPAILR
jgi:hypothetical protein